jgi:DNA-binding CsgD family transcriptional regulator
VKRVAKIIGCRTSIVSSALAQAGVRLSPGGKRSLADADERQVGIDYAAGQSLRQLAIRLNVSTPTIVHCLERQRVALRPAGRGKFWTAELERKVLGWFDNGDTAKAIAIRLNVPVPSVHRALRRARPQPAPSGDRSASWRGGRTVVAGGYVKVRPTPDDLAYCDQGSNGYVLEHRLIVARFLGRRLLASETVHHINGNTGDNRLENLQIRQGRHGRGVAMQCQDCGSVNVTSVPIA